MDTKQKRQLGLNTSTLIFYLPFYVDREFGLFLLQVIAKETRSNEKLFGTARVIVNIIDVNDNLPIFDPPNYDKSIRETAPGGFIVVTVTVRTIYRHGMHGRYSSHLMWK